MKFGPHPVAEAVDAILAHSVALPEGRLRKGHRLTIEDVEALAAAGHDDVIVAILGTDDVSENHAALQLAQAVAGHADGIRLGPPFTGRVNLLAQSSGVVMLDVPALEAVNAVHPMITIATVPDLQQLSEGGMIATIKIISYGVPRDALQVACAAAGGGAITLRPPVLRTATLIITEIDGGAGDKGRAAIEGRLEALNVTLADVVMIPHEKKALAHAISAARSDLVLILTGSATSDPDDVAPTALRMAGGQVERFGMPVDPGNLLFLGTVKATPVIGLPGCARSPALNGADWVLSRVVCGIPVTARDIAGMGVGGLLKEIPSRPQPRRGR
ncbi:molybdopterin-binding protein [Sulfitobacter sp. TSTF-M16]|uniref:Molybdopterin-binding protein n=1 Tax=Sulfitobacter aestuariivivens TaxID=2766981 RepID=A0A927D0V2_9RHOB|nr:molybdopterin-binding protein [Sulfitobacter aestuariivivens]MBD3662990.1 molybdopterin-binding protein [Sulfitobacter aestuariivivens]